MLVVGLTHPIAGAASLPYGLTRDLMFCLIGRGAGPAVVLADRRQRHELAGIDRGHL